MSDPSAVLPELMRRESRSFLQYVREAFPYAKGKDVPMRDAILRIANTEAEFTATLRQLLQKRHIPMPSLGAFPMSFTGSNFQSATALLPKVVIAERQTLEALDRDLPRVTDDEFRSHLEAFQQMKRTHLAELEALTA